MKTILVDAVDVFVIEGEGIFQKMRDLLEEYPNRKIILTGADDKQMEEFGLNDMPYKVFTLKHDPEKTDPKYYEMLLTQFDLSANDVVYFEHNPGAVESAQSVGIASYHYDENTKDLEGLKQFLDDNL
jgi:HAD superfamily hydrolase (TIGR01509 family)